MARMTGDNGALEVQQGTGTTYAALACFRQLNLDDSRDYYDATCMGDSNIVESEGKPRFQGSGEFVADSSNLNTVLAAIRAGGTKNYKLYPDKVTLPATIYSGALFVSGGLNISVAQTLTGPVNIRAAGSIAFATA